MKFNEMKYERPDFEKVVPVIEEIIGNMEKAKSPEELFKAFEEYDKEGSNLDTLFTLAYIRNKIDSRDEFYDKEKDFWDEKIPVLQELDSKKNNVLLNSPFRKEIEEKYGKHLIEKLEVALKTFNPEIMEDLVKENKLASEYQKLTASAMVEYEGEKRTLISMSKLTMDPNRDVRKNASSIVWAWYKDNLEDLDRIYDELVKVRHTIGKKLGYDSFIPVAYARMGRTDWDMEDARNYRKQIAESVVPLVEKLIKEQSERIGIEDMKYYDYALDFLSGNPTPQGDEAYLVNHAKKMYKELSPETDEFFQVMVNQELMDLTNKEGKAPGGFMTNITDYEVPFIFSNFNGTMGDVDVLTHEAGHAFQGYLNRKVRPRDLTSFTSEVAEIHSMSMEYFTHPWMEGFFGEDTEKYYYSHVLSGLKFLPYGASIDEYQEWVYLNPEATPEERRKQYREIEKKFLPHFDYEEVDYLQNGGKWQRQLHVYLYPFYYLDYTLSQVCAFQYFVWDMKNHEEAWNSYLEICRKAGLIPFKELAPKVGLKSPFIDGTIAEITPELEKYMDSLDKSKIK